MKKIILSAFAVLLMSTAASEATWPRFGFPESTVDVDKDPALAAAATILMYADFHARTKKQMAFEVNGMTVRAFVQDAESYITIRDQLNNGKAINKFQALRVLRNDLISMEETGMDEYRFFNEAGLSAEVTLVTEDDEQPGNLGGMSSPEELLEEILAEVENNPENFINDKRPQVARLAKMLVASAKPAPGVQPPMGNIPQPPAMPAAPVNRNVPKAGSPEANMLAAILGGNFELKAIGNQPGGKKVLAGQEENPMAGFAAMAAARKAQMDKNKKEFAFIDEIKDDADKKAIVEGLFKEDSPKVTLSNRSSYRLNWVRGDRDAFIKAMQTKATEFLNPNTVSGRSDWVEFVKINADSEAGVKQVYQITINQPEKGAVKLRFAMTSGARF